MMNPHQSEAADKGPDFFAEHGYAMLSPAIPAPDAQRYAAYALMKRQHPGYYEDQPEYAALSRYSDVMGESLLRNLQPIVEAQTGLKLLPCFSRLRIYAANARIERHIDESAREVSALLVLGGSVTSNWPFWFREGSRDRSVGLAPGDLLIYRGPSLEHWREQLVADTWVELALHYVTADGEFIDHRFDGRRGLGEPQDREQQDRYIALRKQFDAALEAGEDRPCFCQRSERYSCCHGLMQQTLTA